MMFMTLFPLTSIYLIKNNELTPVAMWIFYWKSPGISCGLESGHPVFKGEI